MTARCGGPYGCIFNKIRGDKKTKTLLYSAGRGRILAVISVTRDLPTCVRHLQVLNKGPRHLLSRLISQRFPTSPVLV